MYDASMHTLRMLHGLCTALYLELSLHLTEVCMSNLLLCTDSPVRELPLSWHVFTWIDLQHEVAALNITVLLPFTSDLDICFTYHMLHL